MNTFVFFLKWPLLKSIALGLTLLLLAPNAFANHHFVSQMNIVWQNQTFRSNLLWDQYRAYKSASILMAIYKQIGCTPTDSSTYTRFFSRIVVTAQCPDAVANVLKTNEKSGAYTISKLELTTDLSGPFRYRINNDAEVGLLQSEKLMVYFLKDDGREFGEPITLDNLQLIL